jgi:hypothetical protein
MFVKICPSILLYFMFRNTKEGIKNYIKICFIHIPYSIVLTFSCLYESSTALSRNVYFFHFLIFFQQFNPNSKSHHKKNKTMTLRDQEHPRRNINNLIGDLNKNQTALQNQNLELKILRDQVSNFVYHGDRKMGRSGSMPFLGRDEE